MIIVNKISRAYGPNSANFYLLEIDVYFTLFDDKNDNKRNIKKIFFLENEKLKTGNFLKKKVLEVIIK